MGLLEAGFAIWTMDDFIRRYTGSDESHRTLQLYLGRIWPLQQKEGERHHIPESLILAGVLWKEKYGCGAQRIREKGFAL